MDLSRVIIGPVVTEKAERLKAGSGSKNSHTLAVVDDERVGRLLAVAAENGLATALLKRLHSTGTSRRSATVRLR